MIATISMEKSNWEESISTCNFAQRVALIKNTMTVNTFVDDKVVIRHLKMENSKIKNELEIIKNEKNLIVELQENDFNKCLEMLKMCLKKDSGLDEMMKKVKYSQKWGDYENNLMNEIAYQPVMAIACFNLFVKIIQDKNKLIETLKKRPNNEKEMIEKDHETLKKSRVDLGNIQEVKNVEKKEEIKRNNFLNEDVQIKRKEKIGLNKENENSMNKVSKKLSQRHSKDGQFQDLQITEMIKNQKEKCLEIFKKTKKFSKRFEGLEEDKQLLKEKIHLGKLGSEVRAEK
jgi:hypothetical protein